MKNFVAVAGGEIVLEGDTRKEVQDIVNNICDTFPDLFCRKYICVVTREEYQKEFEVEQMYQIEVADLLYVDEDGCLDWGLYMYNEYPTEKDAWKEIGRILEEDTWCHDMGRWVYRVVEKEGK